jgi:hypothetical protein
VVVYEYRLPTLVTPTKHGGCRQLTTSGGIESGRAAPTFLGLAASRVVRPGRGVSSETTKFFHVISQLDHRYAADVEDIITSPAERDPYTKLRNELVQRLPPQESNASDT